MIHAAIMWTLEALQSLDPAQFVVWGNDPIKETLLYAKKAFCPSQQREEGKKNLEEHSNVTAYTRS